MDPDWGKDRSLKTAESLRAFRDQAAQTLDVHNQRVRDIETRLNEQLELIAEELRQERLADQKGLADSDAQSRMLAELQQALAEKGAEVEEAFERLSAQSQEFETQLAERDRELEELLDLGEAENQQRETLLQEHQENKQQLEQTCRKFELALADVHKLKLENAELREELLSRPEADNQESPELVSLRVERDALAERITELENAPAPIATDDQQQALEDLQRRFEMAVDDVRQLKQENADLQQQLEAAQQTKAAVANSRVGSQDDEPMDWQAQRARLMAALDAEDQGGVDELRRQEHATITGTISITDRVVAEKDTLLANLESEVAAMQRQLESGPEEQDFEELRKQIAAEILGDDQAVQTECAKLQQQQKELESKLREAELEISVQRATLAREQAALEQKLSELPADSCEAEAPSSGKPRRRWLSALGIQEEDA